MPATAIQSGTTPAPDDASTRSNRPLVAALAGLFVLSGAAVLVLLDGHIVPSRDPGTPSVHVGWSWLLTALLIGICWVTSRRYRPTTPTPGPRIGLDLALLTVCAVAFPVAFMLPIPWAEADYVLVKALLLMALPAVCLWLLHRRSGPGVRLNRPRLSVLIVLGALLAIVAHEAWNHFGPGSTPSDLSQYDRTTIIIGATATAITAGFGEELFYRYWLQSRLEALLGRWAGILLASLAFAVMHLASHGLALGLGLGLGTAAVIANQGVFGIAAGYLWSRYRRLWMPVLLHVSSNGLGVAVFLLVG